MQPIVSSDEMKWCDETTIARFGVSGQMLMDRAGIAATRVILRSFPLDHTTVVAVLCGKGNNGGDGCVVARELVQRGIPVRVLLTSAPSAFRGDAAVHCKILHRFSRSLPKICSIGPFSSARKDRSFRPSIVVDALLGTGSSGPPRGTLRTCIEWINAIGVPVVSIDMPTGIDASNGVQMGMGVRADLTVTFGLVKRGLLLNEGRSSAGRVETVDIGIPEVIARDPRIQTQLFERADAVTALPKRRHTLNKYSAGKVLVLAGSRGYTGAAALCALGALRSGAGAVVVGVPDSVHGILAKKLTEPIVVSLPSVDGSFGPASLLAISDRLAWADAIVVGPGIGRSDHTRAFLELLLAKSKKPTIIDADALTMLASTNLLSKKYAAKWILTPHAGELERLSGISSRELEINRIDAPRRFAASKGTTVVFKGSPTVVASANGHIVINSTGNPGMATVGTGDILAGMIGGLCAQGLAPSDAASTGVYLHGMAGDLAKQNYGERAMLASDVLNSLSEVFRSLEGEQSR